MRRSFRRRASRRGAGASCWIVLAIVYPFITDSIDLPILGGHDDLLDASIQTLAYMIMALGLNIVVGFAACSTSATSRSSRSARS